MIVVPSILCSKGIAGQGTELIAWNYLPEHVDIVTQNGYVLARAKVGSFKNVGAYTEVANTVRNNRIIPIN